MADMNRRNVLLGLGTAAAGSGIVFGSGAFTQIDADRTVDVEVVEDAGGLLGLDADDDSEFIEIEDGSFEIALDNANPDAETRIDGALKVTNNTEDASDVDIFVEFDIDGVGEVELQFNESESESNGNDVFANDDDLDDLDDGDDVIDATGDADDVDTASEALVVPSGAGDNQFVFDLVVTEQDQGTKTETLSILAVTEEPS